MNKKIMGRSPILILALLSLVMVGTGAVLIRYWRSSTVTHSYSFTSSGMDAFVFDVPSTGAPITDYMSFLDYYVDPESHVATILKTSSLRENAFGFDVENSIAFCYEGGNIPGDLVINVDVNITGPGSGDVVWTVTSHLAGVISNSANGGIPAMQDSDLPDYVFVDGTVTIPQAELERITWVAPADYISSPGIPSGYANLCFLEFQFSSGGEGIPIEDYGTHSVGIDIAIELLVDDGA